MATLYTNENNPLALKLLVCANLSPTPDLTLKIVGLQDKSLAAPKHLPFLQLADGRVLFVSNTAAMYLLPPESSDESAVNEWLEWESSVLRPIVLGCVGKVEGQKKILECYLQKLERELARSATIISGKITAADAALWALLYPLYKEKGLQEFVAPFTQIVKWLQFLESKQEFQKALSAYRIEGGTCYTALQSGAKCILSQQNVGVQESPTHAANVSDVATVEEVENAERAWKKTVNDLPLPKSCIGPCLPKKGEKNILITSALPYVNNVPHLGNIIGCVLSADVFARFCRMCNYNTLFISGTDEYGTATETKALEEGLTCKEICDKYYKIHSEIYKWFNISFDHFGRTSAPEQKVLCQEMFLVLNNNGFMFTEPVEQLHCSSCNRYLADRFVEGGCPHPGCNFEDARGDQCDGCGKLVNANELKNPRCKICGSTPQKKSSCQFFIDLPKLEPLLLHWMKQSAPGWSNNAQVIAKAWLKEGLKPRCITRDLKWGVPVPLDGFREKVFYVWFDAPIGYMSISKRYTEEWEKWWRPEAATKVTLYQFMAKDNVPFHSIMFPATLLGANKGYTTVSHIMSTEYLNYEDGKFSKSRGIGVFGNDAQNTGIPNSVWRFYLLYVRPESQDSSFSWSDLATKTNSELLNNLGNFINRALMFAKNNFGRIVPQMKPTKEDFHFLALCTREYKNYVMVLEKAKLRDGIRSILTISRHGNQYMQSTQPWVLLKGSASDKERAATIIGICCNIACLLAALLHPYMPESSEALLRQLNTTLPVLTPEQPEIVQFLQPGHEMNEPSPLFTRIEPARVDELKKLFAGKQSENGKSKPSAEKAEGAGDLKDLEGKVAQQADKVRKLKASGVGKDVWQSEVSVLLDLKKKLEVAQKNGSNNVVVTVQNGVTDSTVIKRLEEDVEKQGLVVRKLKESGKEKAIWQPEVEKLLQLKAKLAAATGHPPVGQKNKKKK